jgi:hypothetical protein
VHIIATSRVALQQNVKNVNPLYEVDLQSCTTAKGESLHAVHHLKKIDLPHMLEHSKAFGNAVKESLKCISPWSAHYYTKSASYYPITRNGIKFQDIPKLTPLPPVSMPIDQIVDIENGLLQGEKQCVKGMCANKHAVTKLEPCLSMLMRNSCPMHQLLTYRLKF